MNRKPVAASYRTSDKNAKRVLRALEDATRGRTNANDPIVEQLRQCPEAFKVGEILGKAFDSLKYAQDGARSENGTYRQPGWSFRRSCDRAAAGRYVPQAQGDSMAVLHKMG